MRTIHHPLITVILLVCAADAADAVGGGWTAAGPVGEYFANSTLSGTPAFTRREVRLDFDWGTVRPVGGSTAARYRTFPTDDFSVRWTGRVLPAFSETYTFSADADDGVRVSIRAAGTSAWTSLIDRWTTAGTWTGTAALTAGTEYDLKVEYRELTGAARLSLKWSSPSTPLEVIDPVAQLGFNTEYTLSQAWADIVKCARNTWEDVDGLPRPTLDAAGWPQGDGKYVFQESLNEGLDVDPLMRGRIAFTFTGKATVSINGNVDKTSLAYTYDAGTNTTSGSFRCIANGWNASEIAFRQTDRTGQSPARRNGITGLRLMRPTAPDADTAYAGDELVTAQVRSALSDWFTVLRLDLNNANQERFWSDRTPPTWFNQSEGRTTTSVYPSPYFDPSPFNNGPSWEHKIMLCNETGRDLYINLPLMATGWSTADTGGYVNQVAKLIRYGSDANGTPYAQAVANPVHPPLNPNLRVYVELCNELWNWGGTAFLQSSDLVKMTQADADAALGSSSDPLARAADFAIVNYDNLPTTQRPDGEYHSALTWRWRKVILRLTQISDIFRATWGDAAMGSRVRTLYEWQYGNLNATASEPLKFADEWFNNGDGKHHVATPRPISHWIWGGGGATYYGARNPYGVTAQLANAGFDQVAVPAGYALRPGGHGWTFTGTAGIARDGGAGDDIPPAFSGSQMAYLDGTGAIERTVTIPATQTANVYAIVFKAVQRTRSGGGVDSQKLTVSVDGVALNARSFNQDGQGYLPTAWNSDHPWEAHVVFWTRGTEYYSTRTFTATPGQTVTVRIAGTAAAGQIAFVEEVRLASVDQLFADGMPGGGEANGQPVGSNYQSDMDTQVDWALAYGLQPMTYEGGWSLGSDTGGSPMQLQAKYGSPQAEAVNLTALRAYQRAGGAINTYGTYAQWPSWSSSYAVEGLLDLTAFPLLRAQRSFLASLPAAPVNGVQVPAALGPANAALASSGVPVASLAARGWMTWNLIAPQTGTYAFAITTGAGGAYDLVLDGATTVCSGTSGGTRTGTVLLTKGIHGLRLRGTGAGGFSLTRIDTVISGAPTAPAITGVSDGNLSLSVTWGAVAGATGYRLRWGTVSGQPDHVIECGTATAWTLTGLVHDTTYFFDVIAYNAAGPSQPSPERSAVALADGQSGTLLAWDFLASGSVDGGAVSVPVTSASARLDVGSLVRGAGFTASALGYQNDRGAFATTSDLDGLTMAEARTKGLYVQWTVAPRSGTRMSLTTLSVAAFGQSTSPALEVEWSADGFATAGTLAGTAIAGTDWNGTVHTFALSGFAALQNTQATITFRAYLHGNQTSIQWSNRGFGQIAGFNNDIAIAGSVATVVGANTPPTIAPIADQTLVAGGSVTVPVTVADAETAASSLVVTAISSNTAVVPAAGLVLGGSGGSRTLAITPASGATGTATITLIVRDATNATASRAFTVTVAAAIDLGINFQPATAPIPAGFLKDHGQAYADRGNGWTYGWSLDLSAITWSRDRNHVDSPDQVHDTHLLVGKNGGATATWEIAVPAGTYLVTVLVGDPLDRHQPDTVLCLVEGAVAIDGRTTTEQNWLEGAVEVPVVDGRLSLHFPGGVAVTNKVCAIGLVRRPGASN